MSARVSSTSGPGADRSTRIPTDAPPAGPGASPRCKEDVTTTFTDRSLPWEPVAYRRRMTPREIRPRCSSCGHEPPDLLAPVTWSMGVADGMRTWLCLRCTREHLRLIEARGDVEGWRKAMRTAPVVATAAHRA